MARANQVGTSCVTVTCFAAKLRKAMATDAYYIVLATDVDADYGSTSHWTDREQFKSEFAAFHAPFDSTQHTMSPHVIDVDGDRARSFCNGGWRLIRKAVDRSPLWDGSGWYDDALLRTPDGWRITRRVCRITWWTGNPSVNETIPGGQFPASAHLRQLDGMR